MLTHLDEISALLQALKALVEPREGRDGRHYSLAQLSMRQKRVLIELPGKLEALLQVDRSNRGGR